MSITNNPPFELYFKRPEFYLLQSNYETLKEIVFTDHTTVDILRFANNSCTVAIFKVIPKKQTMVINEAGELEAYENMYR